jgi:hypothetical protein
MRLAARGLRFSRITRHVRVSQCLAAAGDAPWYLAVARPGAQPPLAPSDIQAFAVTPPAALALSVGTWHAGPYFGTADDGGAGGGFRDFYNLELSDTNVNDHTSFDFGDDAGAQPRRAFRIVPPPAAEAQ